MPWGLKRFHKTGQLHFITFSCYRRRPKLGTARARNAFELALEQARQRYGFSVTGYVVMPEHMHLLFSEPERGTLAVALKRGLVERPEDWKWSSFLHHATGVEGPVEIESEWTARKRERMGIFPMVRTLKGTNYPAQAELGRGTLEGNVEQKRVARATRPDTADP